MSLVDDQVIREEKYNALDELSKRINKVPLKDVSLGINETSKFLSALEKGKEAKLVAKPNKREVCIDSAALVSGIMSDMEN